MPYIKEFNRKKLENYILNLAANLIHLSHPNSSAPFNVASEGDLNYTITELLVQSLCLHVDPKYAKINAAIGILECVKLELYRRLAAEYEDKKILEEGDIPCYKAFNNNIEPDGWLTRKNKN